MSEQETVRFYCGVNESTWNYHPVAPGKYACIAPVYGRSLRTKMVNRVRVPFETAILQDSGAFSDGPGQRLSVEQALERQIAHAELFGYASQVTHRASYDVLIDEKWSHGLRHKARWTEQEAQEAVEMTVHAAVYLAHHRDGVGAVLSLQGVSAKQYLACAERIVPLLETGDMLGLGGWCILGKVPSLLTVFRETLRVLLPFLGKEAVKQVHIWGVCFPDALRELVWWCAQYGIKVSTDSAHPSIHPVFGQWGYADWRDKLYVRPPILDSCRAGMFDRCERCRGLERARHVAATRDWLGALPVQCPFPYQLSLMEVSR